MTTAPRSVAVVATRLPIIDRRALSQAWFSALHMAPEQGTRPAPKPAPPAGGSSAWNASAPSSASSAAARTAAAPARTAVQTPRGVAAAAPAVDRRAPETPLSRRIERALARHAVEPPERHLTIAIASDDGRVALLVRSEGTSTRIVALCAPEVRERVDRALARARFALAAAGTRVEAGAL